MEERKYDSVVITIDQDGATGGLQLSIGIEDAEGYGHGDRLIGPKYIGASTNLRRKVLTHYDADRIRCYLDMMPLCEHPKLYGGFCPDCNKRIADRAEEATG
jgi:predicted GIY-YIG superfamily endonuclease